MVGNLVAKVEKFAPRESSTEAVMLTASPSPTVPQIRVDLTSDQLNAIVQQWHTLSLRDASTNDAARLGLYAGSHLIAEVVVRPTQLQELPIGSGTSPP